MRGGFIGLSKEIVGFPPPPPLIFLSIISIKCVWNCGAAEGRAVRARGWPAVRSGCSIECECPLLHSLLSSWPAPLHKPPTAKKPHLLPFSCTVMVHQNFFRERATRQTQSQWCRRAVEFTASTPTVNIRIFNEYL